MKLIDISTPKYPNTFVKVDDDDFEYLNQWKWYPKYGKYAVRSLKDPRPRVIRMHRQIMNPEAIMQVDHVNRDGLDNRRENLRICTGFQNARNSKKRSHGVTSKYKGVCWSGAAKKFQAYIVYETRNIHLGLFKIEEDAALAYDSAAEKYHGEFCSKNFTNADRK